MKFSSESGLPTKVIAMANLSTASGRDFVNGVLTGIRREWKWDLNLVQQDPPLTVGALRTAIRSGVAGVIIHAKVAPPVRRVLAESDIAIVMTSVNDPLLGGRPNYACVHSDNGQIGRLGADHLLSCGATRACAFVSAFPDADWSKRRREAFRARTDADGRPAADFICRTAAEVGKLSDFLLRLPKPAAVMCDCDVAAVRTIKAAKTRGIEIPTQLTVLGVDNDELLCESVTPPISSIMPGHNLMGIRAAEALDRLLTRGKAPRKPILVRAIDLVRRESTDAQPSITGLVSRAKEYIRTHACRENIKVVDVVRFLRVSRRLAELRFRQSEGLTIRAAIEARRLEEAKHLLTDTRLPIAEIARKSGFGSPFQLCRIFKARLGVSPSGFRDGNFITGSSAPPRPVPGLRRAQLRGASPWPPPADARAPAPSR